MGTGFKYRNVGRGVRQEEQKVFVQREEPKLEHLKLIFTTLKTFAWVGG